jgi:hypothetical protein
MGSDPELDAISAVNAALAPLDEAAASRVLRWAADRYQVSLGLAGQPRRAQQSGATADQEGEEDEEERPDATSESEPSSDQTTFNDVSELFDAANPKTESDKALVVGYWFQVAQRRSDFGGQEVNNSLKHLGHGATNITRALGSLMNRSPRLVMQTHKAGKATQARKKYRLTTEGIRAVEKMTGRKSAR